MKNNKEILTYSSLKNFCDCRKLYWWKDNQGYYPIRQIQTLTFGKAVHECLHVWYSDPTSLSEYIDSLYPQRDFDPEEKKDWLLLRAIMQGYINLYMPEEFESIYSERQFSVDIKNPYTNRKSRSFELKGKVDGIVKMKNTGEYYLIEHKTVTNITGGYLEKIAC